MSNKALIVVDVQEDFVEGGSLACEGGRELAKRILEDLVVIPPGQEADSDWKVATQDWHEDPGDHWSDTPDYVDTWPIHCPAGQRGAELVLPLSPILFDAVFHKGMKAASYSGFDGEVADQRYWADLPADRTQNKLLSWLRDRGVTELDICGIATEYCVKATVLDALRFGFQVNVLANYCVPVSAQDHTSAIADMMKAGAVIRDEPFVFS